MSVSWLSGGCAVIAARMGSALRLVAEPDDAAGEGAGIEQGERQTLGDSAEQALPGTNDHWEQQQPEFVEQSLSQQRSHQAGAATDRDVPAGLPRVGGEFRW